MLLYPLPAVSMSCSHNDVHILKCSHSADTRTWRTREQISRQKEETTPSPLEGKRIHWSTGVHGDWAADPSLQPPVKPTQWDLPDPSALVGGARRWPCSPGDASRTQPTEDLLLPGPQSTAAFTCSVRTRILKTLGLSAGGVASVSLGDQCAWIHGRFPKGASRWARLSGSLTCRSPGDSAGCSASVQWRRSCLLPPGLPLPLPFFLWDPVFSSESGADVGLTCQTCLPKATFPGEATPRAGVPASL